MSGWPNISQIFKDRDIYGDVQKSVFEACGLLEIFRDFKDFWEFIVENGNRKLPFN